MYLACEMADAKTSLKASYDIRLPENIDYVLQKDICTQSSIIMAFSYLFSLLEGTNENAYNNLKNLLLEKAEQFSAQDSYTLYVGLLNHSTRLTNQHGDLHSYKKYLYIIRQMLAKGWLYTDDCLSPWLYRNIVHAALKAGEEVWAKDFAMQYRGDVCAAFRDDIFLYVQAYIAYCEKEYSKAQLLLAQHNPKDVLLNISCRSLLIKLYYEDEQEELLLHYLEATRIFLIRNKVLDEQLRQQMLKFVEITAKLARLAPFEQEKLYNLLHRLPPAQQVMHREWLRERLVLKSES